MGCSALWAAEALRRAAAGSLSVPIRCGLSIGVVVFVGGRETVEYVCESTGAVLWCALMRLSWGPVSDRERQRHWEEDATSSLCRVCE